MSTPTSEEFWDDHYRKLTSEPSGRPSAILVQYAGSLAPGRSLDLGSSRGDDVIWLARQGWWATGVDVSRSAISAAKSAAIAAGVHERTQFVAQDLAERFPDGSFDLVTAMFLQSPIPFGRTEVLRRAAGAVAPGGLLLLATHGSRAPWSWSDPGTVFPTARAELADLALDPNDWRELFVDSQPRIAKGPNGAQAEVLDTVVAIERR